jgi:hypothetical protein
MISASIAAFASLREPVRLKMTEPFSAALI